MGPWASRAIAAWLLGLPFLVPHVLEDFQRGIAQRVGLSTEAGMVLLGAWLAIQVQGLILVGQGQRAGLLVTAVTSAVWVAGAVGEHGLDLLASGGGFRAGPASLVWVAGLFLSQSLAWLFALLALRRHR